MLPIETASELFLVRCRQAGHSPATLVTYDKTLRQFSEYLKSQGTESADKVTAAQVYGFVDSEPGRTVATVNSYIRRLKTLFRFLSEEGYVTTVLKLRMRKEWPRVRQFPSPKDFSKLLSSFPDGKSPFITCRNQFLTRFLADTGLRIGEACALTLEDVDLRARAVLVRKGKGNKSRLVALSSTLLPDLVRYLRERGMHTKDDNPYVFPGERSQDMTVHAYQQALRRACLRSGVKISPHGLRHYHGTMWAEAGGDLVTLQHQLGHESLSTTARYLHESFDSARAKHDEFTPVKAWPKLGGVTGERRRGPRVS